MGKQLEFFPSDEELRKEHEREMGINPEIYTDGDDPDRGRPGQGEKIVTPTFFLKLYLGEDQLYPIKDELCWMERGNRANKYELDHRIVSMKNQKKKLIGRLDTEIRKKPGKKPGGDFPFTPRGRSFPYNVPIKNWTSNWDNWPEEKKPLSGKMRYYLDYPFSSFFLSLRNTFKEGVCIWAWDILLSPIRFQPVNKEGIGDFMVFQVPRRNTCYGRQHEDTIENYVVRKLSLPIKVLEGLWKKHGGEIRGVKRKLWGMEERARTLMGREGREGELDD